jgi:LacI family transcriptional regulator
LAVIHGSLESSATADRIAGFRRGVQRLGRSLLDVDLPAALGSDHLALGHAATAKLLAQPVRPAAIFCASDLIAYGTHRRLREAGLRVPQDIALFGFDDNPLNDWIAPWLASVRVPYAAFGPAIVAMLGEMWRGEKPAARLLDYTLVARP